VVCDDVERVSIEGSEVELAEVVASDEVAARVGPIEPAVDVVVLPTFNILVHVALCELLSIVEVRTELLILELIRVLTVGLVMTEILVVEVVRDDVAVVTVVNARVELVAKLVLRIATWVL
jgi:hypothetical protein